MQNLGVILRTFWEKAVSYLTLQMSLTDIIEIIIISVLIYYMLVWIKDTRAWMLLRGILVILAFVLLAVLFEMNTIVWIADKLFNVAMIAVVVIFQPEMRKALENLGRKNILVNLFNFDFMITEFPHFLFFLWGQHDNHAFTFKNRHLFHFTVIFEIVGKT